ncbi:hypothetical protein P691DRAFT_811559, partial [Macrolepiota fuliginosa MF-IS2]
MHVANSSTVREAFFVPLHLCYTSVIPRWYFAIWLPMIGYESMLLGMAAWAVIVHYREIKILPSTSEQSPALSYLLMRDSILFPM